MLPLDAHNHTIITKDLQQPHQLSAHFTPMSVSKTSVVKLFSTTISDVTHISRSWHTNNPISMWMSPWFWRLCLQLRTSARIKDKERCQACVPHYGTSICGLGACTRRPIWPLICMRKTFIMLRDKVIARVHVPGYGTAWSRSVNPFLCFTSLCCHSLFSDLVPVSWVFLWLQIWVGDS